MNICVFCSSSQNIDNKYFNLAKELIKFLKEENHTLVYGGAKIGTMGVLADEALSNNIKIKSIIPEKIYNAGVANTKVEDIVITKTMHERKKTMEDISDAFITLPGGFGTLEELIEVITLKQLGYHNKPIVILNSYDFYKPLLSVFKKFYVEKFTNPAFEKLYYITNSVKDIFVYLKNYNNIKTQDTSKFYHF